MANSDYTFMNVVEETGFFSKEEDTGYSAGVKILQDYLKIIGYSISDSAGRFQSSTETAVKGFQREFGFTQTGVANSAVCLRLNTVRTSQYFNTYGKPITSSEWGLDNILTGKFDNVDLLARIIVGESGYVNLPDQGGVALVLSNRAVNSNKVYWVPQVDAPNASIYARVVGKKSAYGSAYPNHPNAERPTRGVNSSKKDGFISPGWKNAVELARLIVNKYKIAVTGYKLSGTTILITATGTVNTEDNKDYLNQIGWSKYEDWVEKGSLDLNVQPYTFSQIKNANIICKSK